MSPRHRVDGIDLHKAQGINDTLQIRTFARTGRCFGQPVTIKENRPRGAVVDLWQRGQSVARLDQFRVRHKLDQRGAFDIQSGFDRLFDVRRLGDLFAVCAAQSGKGREGRVLQIGFPDRPFA